MQIRLREYREGQGLTLEQMAERSGFSYSQLSRWETGESNIPSGKLPILAEAYRCPVSEIFSDEGGPGGERAEIINLWEAIPMSDRKSAKDVLVKFAGSKKG